MYIVKDSVEKLLFHWQLSQGIIVPDHFTMTRVIFWSDSETWYCFPLFPTLSATQCKVASLVELFLSVGLELEHGKTMLCSN